MPQTTRNNGRRVLAPCHALRQALLSRWSANGLRAARSSGCAHAVKRAQSCPWLTPRETAWPTGAAALEDNGGRELQSKLPADPAGRGRSLAGCPHAQRFITLAHATRRGRRRRTNRGRTCGRAGHVCLANAAGRRLECAIELEDAGLRRRGRGGAISLAVADSCGVSAFEGGHRHRGEGHATRPSRGYGAASRGGGGGGGGWSRQTTARAAAKMLRGLWWPLLIARMPLLRHGVIASD